MNEVAGDSAVISWDGAVNFEIYNNPRINVTDLDKYYELKAGLHVLNKDDVNINVDIMTG